MFLSGHEFFPCKTLWLKKGYDFHKANKDFNSPNAFVELGVGKNMVAAIRYWYKVFELKSDDERIKWIPDYLFNDQDGKDRFMEDLGTLWLLYFWFIQTLHLCTICFLLIFKKNVEDSTEIKLLLLSKKRNGITEIIWKQHE